MSDAVESHVDLVGIAPTATLTRKAVRVFRSTIAASVISFVFVLLVARIAGPAARGALAFTVAVPNLLSFAATLGMETSNLYFGAKHPKARGALVTISLAEGMVVGGALAAGALGIFRLAPGLVPPELSGSLLVIGLAATPLIAVQYMLLAALISSDNLLPANLIRVTMPAVSVIIFVLAAAAASGNLRTAVIAWSAGQAAGFVLAVSVSVRRMGIARPRTALRAAPEALTFGLRAHAGSLADLATYRLDTVILAAYWDAREVGIYAVAVNVAEVLLYLPTAVGNVILPARARRSRHAPGHPERVLIRVVGVLVILAVAGVATASFLVPLVFGESFVGSVGPTKILLVAMVGMGARTVLRAEFTALNKQTLASVIAVFTLILVLALDLALIPSHGASGAAWASAIAYLLGGAVIAAVWRRIRPRIHAAPRD